MTHGEQHANRPLRIRSCNRHLQHARSWKLPTNPHVDMTPTVGHVTWNHSRKVWKWLVPKAQLYSYTANCYSQTELCQLLNSRGGHIKWFYHGLVLLYCYVRTDLFHIYIVILFVFCISVYIDKILWKICIVNIY